MKDTLAKLAAGQTLSAQETVTVFEQLMTGTATATQTAALLAMMQLRSPTVDEIVGAATVMRRHASKLQTPADLIAVDTCGAGGDGAQTFNISTAAALVTAGAGRAKGVVVAKHGNRSVTSKSGSSQVLEALGVNLHVAGETLTKCLEQAGLCFCFAPLHHPAMKHAAPIRNDLGFRTIFNLLGPLTNPAGARRQVIGVFAAKWTEPIAQALAQLGAEYAMVVHGLMPCADGASAGLDEISTAGPTQISIVRDGKVTTEQFNPASLHLAPATLDDLRADGVESSAAVIRSVLSGQKDAARDIVCLNAAAALVVTELADNLTDGFALAQQAIDDGAAQHALDQLIQITQSAAANA